MSWRRILFDTLYRLGRPIWDIPVPEEVHAIAEGPEALPPGRVPDLGWGTVIQGDVTKLTAQGITGPFDLVIDNGCYHSLSAADKTAYIREVAVVMKPGAPLLMWEDIRLGPNEIPERFAPVSPSSKSPRRI